MERRSLWGDEIEYNLEDIGGDMSYAEERARLNATLVPFAIDANGSF